jgi:acyl carrier protein
MTKVDRIRDYIVENFLFGNGDDLKEDTSFYDDRILDSTGLLGLVLFIEQEFDIRIADDEVTPENLDSLAKINRFLTSKCEQPAGAGICQ